VAFATLHMPPDVQVVGFDRGGQTQVRRRVPVRAAHPRFTGQRRVGGVDSCLGDMTGRVARHVDDPPASPQNFEGVAPLQRFERARDRLCGRTVHRAMKKRAQRIDAADVIGVVVRH
jgi:hypothetical protein